jgi:predicted porin
MYGGRIGYAAGPFNVAGAYSSTDITPDIDATNWNVAGSWDFKIVKLSAFYSSIEAKGFGQKESQDNWFVGASMPFGQANFKLSWGQADGGGLRNALGAKQWALGADYNLSKRTAMYATVSAVNNNNNSAFRVANTSALQAGTNSTGGEVGIRHSF